ncbi:MAG TPA: prepilin-type N-terminal cleavage/methylation domain-containing protein [Blastocatellia bacterium]|nr:prepilin-type N-terminal cleavage/methylation domain-containing protein [Blastocatellia bacterium]
MQRKSHRGFSILELTAVAAIIGITSAIAVPSLMGQLRSYRLDAAAQQVTQALQAAKLEAVRNNASYQVTFDTSNNTIQAASNTAVALPQGVHFVSLASASPVPSIIQSAVTAASADTNAIPGQQTNSLTAVSFPASGSANTYVATFTARGLPGRVSGSTVTSAPPGMVNWVYLTNDQNTEKQAVTITNAGGIRIWRWDAATSQWK